MHLYLFKCIVKLFVLEPNLFEGLVRAKFRDRLCDWKVVFVTVIGCILCGCGASRKACTSSVYRMIVLFERIEREIVDALDRFVLFLTTKSVDCTDASTNDK